MRPSYSSENDTLFDQQQAPSADSPPPSLLRSDSAETQSPHQQPYSSPTGLGIVQSPALPAGLRSETGDFVIARNMARSLVIGPSPVATRRYQPYLSTINTDRSSWAPATNLTPLNTHHPATSTFSTDSPISSESNPYSGSMYSATSTHHPSSGIAGHPITYLGPSGTDFQPSPYSSDYGAQHSSHRSYTGTAFSPQSLTPTFTHGSNLSSAISPTIQQYAQTPVSPRRHTFSGPYPLGIGGSPGSVDSMGVTEVDDVVVKEEKRRRNKESSQRFRDRTRERQREKQERLEYLERRVKHLEEQLKEARLHSAPSDGAGKPGGAPVARLLIGDNESAMVALTRLQRENDGLRAALRTAEQELIRSRSPYQCHSKTDSSTRDSVHNSPEGFSQIPSGHSSPGGFSMTTAPSLNSCFTPSTCSAPVTSQLQQTEFPILENELSTQCLSHANSHQRQLERNCESTTPSTHQLQNQLQHCSSSRSQQQAQTGFGLYSATPTPTTTTTAALATASSASSSSTTISNGNTSWQNSQTSCL